MDPTPTPGRAIDSRLTSPELLLNADGVHTTRVVREQDESHFETRDSLAGFVIVGITAEADEVFLTSTSNGRFWRLPYGEVDTDTDYLDEAASVLDTIQEQTGIEASIEQVVGIRRFDAVLEDSPAADIVSNTPNPDPDELSVLDGHTTTHDVILEARATSGESLSGTANEISTVDWFGEIPEGAPAGLPGADLELFID